MVGRGAVGWGWGCGGAGQEVQPALGSHFISLSQSVKRGIGGSYTQGCAGA